jgi:hypothetical protein
MIRIGRFSITLAVLGGLIGVSVLILSFPRMLASYHILSIKSELKLKTLTPKQYQGIKAALELALTWTEDPEYYFLLERSLSRVKNHYSREISPLENYQVRIRLLKKGLSISAVRPYEWARLAHLYTLTGDQDLAEKTLWLSMKTGPFVPPLSISRLISLSHLWAELSDGQKRDFSIIIKLALLYQKDEVVRLTTRNIRLLRMVKFSLRGRPAELEEFYKLFLKKISKPGV